MKNLFLFAFSIIIFSACLNEPKLAVLENNYQLNDKINLTLDKEISISKENIHLTFVKVKDESRCPETWTCLWEGEATVRLTLQKGEITESFDLKYQGGDCIDCGTSIKLIGYEIKLVDLLPFPDDIFYNKQPLNFDDYEITIEVSNDDEIPYS
jgi:hypothetical protein